MGFPFTGGDHEGQLIYNHFARHIEVINFVSERLTRGIEQFALTLAATLRNGRKLLVMGMAVPPPMPASGSRTCRALSDGAAGSAGHCPDNRYVDPDCGRQ